ncbi:MAG: PssD/Cps14F family polysaccharide biosynthesis glycosyltransferase [Syntrophales bacterium]
MKKILFVAGSGGHVAQLSILLKKIGDKYDSELMLEKSDKLGIEKFSKKYRIYTANSIRGKSESVLMTLFRILLNSFQSLIILITSNPKYIITTGPGLGIPICILGKIIGKKIIVIESWSRTKTKSYVGKVLYPFSDLFFVQWPEMVKQYPKAKYVGRLA